MTDPRSLPKKALAPGAGEKPAPLGAGRALIFCLSLLVMVVISAWPHFLGATPATVNHNAAMVLMMGMSCGFVYGIGFTPRLVLWRWLFSGWSALGLFVVGMAMLLW